MADRGVMLPASRIERLSGHIVAEVTGASVYVYVHPAAAVEADHYLGRVEQLGFKRTDDFLLPSQNDSDCRVRVIHFFWPGRSDRVPDRLWPEAEVEVHAEQPHPEANRLQCSQVQVVPIADVRTVGERIN